MGVAHSFPEVWRFFIHGGGSPSSHDPIFRLYFQFPAYIKFCRCSSIAAAFHPQELTWESSRVDEGHAELTASLCHLV